MPDFLPVRDAFADYAHVRSEEMFAGAGREPPLLTIAIRPSAARRCWPRRSRAR